MVTSRSVSVDGVTCNLRFSTTPAVGKLLFLYPSFVGIGSTGEPLKWVSLILEN